jgi:hypothetical protein
MTDFNNTSKIALWKNTSDNSSAPVLKGSFYAHRDIKEGEQIDVSLWRVDSATANSPALKGKIQDKFVKDGFTDAPPVAASEDIPF